MPRHVISTAPVDLAQASAIETAELRAWAELTAAVPPDHVDRIELHVSRLAGALVLRCRGGGFHRGLFNRPIGFGVLEPVTRDAVDDLVAGYREAGVDRFIVPLQPHCRPPELEGWLVAAGLGPHGAWDRIVRGGEPLQAEPSTAAGRRLEVSVVDSGSVDAWADFLCDVYHVDAGPWLRALLDRPGWRHFLAREDGEIVAARSRYLPSDGGLVFLAIDGPVPGVMTSDYAPDAALCRAIVEDGLARGANGFVADVEAPSPSLDTPAYEDFGRLGFTRPYARIHYALP